MEQAERSEQTRNNLLTAARDLVVDGGWRALTIRKVGERAGVNPALIRYHFGGKEQMLAAMLDRAVAEVISTYSPIERSASLRSFIREAVLAMERIADDPNARVVLASMLEAENDPQFAPPVSKNLHSLRSHLGEAVRTFGTRRADISGMETALAAVLDGLLLHLFLDPDTDVSGAAEILTRLAG